MKYGIADKALSMPSGILSGITASIAISLGGSALMAKLLEQERMEDASIGYGIILMLIVSSFIGAILASSMVKRRTLLVCILTGIGYFASLAATTALFFGGQYSGMHVTLLIIMGGCAAAFIMRTGRKSHGGRRKIQI